ncbi:hypothetical protein BXT86_05875 [candidate division WOR-3 bacterium 4484_100]|uniref:Peptidase M14 domain-containing protein n=1 Tax=candidate division WOR-3 bacterium 4484_100 TaxID=1936077 RepID=A0A1V4QEA4_UNCW3|nr:MAG: hypothetical protein BXT86_05875 [candidate division WOR-3 bacterium 4484_100]
MKKYFFILLAIIGLAFSENTTRLIKIHLAEHQEVYRLNRLNITITDAGRDYAKALVNDKEIKALQDAGYKVEVLIPDYRKYKREIFERGFYHTYDQVYAVLDSFATNYPDICRLDTIGFSVQGRAIWAMRVTDNPQIEEQEPEIRLAGNMHGDENIGTEITLYFLRYLLTNYSSNPQVQNLVNNREFWILPTLNPDGKVAVTRQNANGVDLNRDYGYFWEGWGNSPAPSSQIENKVLMAHLEENNISLEYNYHSTALYVNYPWDYHPADPPDSDYIITLSQIYADSANLNPINGYDWYQVTGSLQDYTIGTSGCLAWTVETDEPSSSSAIDQICYDNRDALMDVCERAGWGIEGVVKDSMTNNPLYTRIEFLNPERIDIYNDPGLGDFHKMIAPGTYDVRVSANTYAPKIITGVVVPQNGSVSLGDILLASDSTYLYAFRVVLCRYVNHAEDQNRTRPRFALGAEDNRFFSLGQAGFVVLDMGPNTPIRNSPGYDFTVYEGDDGADEGYEVFVSDAWDGTWHSCGSAFGTANFDLSVAGVSQARYVKVVDDGTSTSGQYAGFDLDAIKGVPPANTPSLYIADYQIIDGNNGILEPGETADLVITLHNSGILEATNTQGLLTSTDNYITINDSTGSFGNIMPDSEQTNNQNPFNITADSSTPTGHTAHFDLIVSADNYLDTLGLDLVVGKKHYYVWNPDPTPESGQQIDSLLTELGYSGDYGTSLAQDLSKYQAVFVCVGVYSNNYVISNNSPEAQALVDYLQTQNGRMYLEGGDVWYYDPLYNSGYDFGPLFGINATSDGSGDLGPVLGQDSTFTVGMNFSYGGENSYIDHIPPTGSDAFLIFDDGDDNYDCGVARDPGSYKTVGTSFELGGLIDGTGVSTRSALLDSIMHFFGVFINPGVEEESGLSKRPIQTRITNLFPNPAKQRIHIEYQLNHNTKLSLKVYDVTGSLVRTIIESPICRPGSYTTEWDTKDNNSRYVSTGIYFVHLNTSDYKGVKKVVILK